MRMAVFGAGGVGAHLAARLASAGVPVSLVARGAHLRAIREAGLTLLAGEKRVTVTLRATDDAVELGVQDVAVVALKGTQLPGAVQAIRPLLGPETRVLFVMNGLPWWFPHGLDLPVTPALAACLDRTGRLAGLVPVTRTFWGVVTGGGSIVEPGVVRNTTPGVNSIVLGAPDDAPAPGLRDLAALLGGAGYAASVTGNIRAAIWSKLLTNAGSAMVATATDRNHLEVTSDPETRGVIVATMRELLLIGEAIGLAVAADPVAMTEPGRYGTHVSSFLQDLRAGRPLELDGTILAAREIARAKGVAAPHLTTVAAIVAALSANLAWRAEVARPAPH